MKFIDLEAQQNKIRAEIEQAISKVLDHGQYIMGPEVKEFESELKKFTKAKHAITCANGTDALTLVLMAWGIGPGDAVFVPAFTFVASAEAPAQLGATPFFVDVRADTFNIDPESLKLGIAEAKSMGLSPKVVIGVDMFGLMSNVDELIETSHSENMKILIDGAQSFGAEYNGHRVGSLGDATTTSFFPAKPLGCYGDGGAIFTSDDNDAEVLQSLRIHGKGSEKYDNVRIGLNSRLDTLQAAILLEKIKILPEELKLRSKVAETYNAALRHKYRTPMIHTGFKSAWAQYTLIVDDRVNLMQRLKDNGIPSVIYYPKALSQQSGYRMFPSVSSGVNISEQISAQVMSLPMHPYLSGEQQAKIINVLLDS